MDTFELATSSTALANDFDTAQLDEIAIQQINPRILEAIESIQAERLGLEPISWSDFSSHTSK